MDDMIIPLPADMQQLSIERGRKINRISIEVPAYGLSGIWSAWEEHYKLFIDVGDGDATNTVTVRADKGGLITLARHLLTLAQDDHPIGSHFHFDEWNGLDEGSSPLIIDKIEP